MIAAFHKPIPVLQDYIESFFYFEGFIAEHVVERFLPDGNNEIIFDLTDTPKHIYHNETLKEIQACNHVWVSGLRTEPITIPSGNENRMLVVTFRKGKIRNFLPFPATEITDYVLDSDLIYGSLVKVQREQLISLGDPQSMFRSLEKFFLQLGGGNLNTSTQQACVSFALDQLVANPGMVVLNQLTSRIGYSQKHFISLFKEQVGITPKAYARILRFQRALAEIKDEPDWTNVALEAGYYDQAHFVNDFKHFSGLSPGQYYHMRGENQNYIPIQ